MNKKKYVIDIESTGLDKDNDDLLVIGVYDYKTFKRQEPNLNNNYWQIKGDNLIQDYQELHDLLDLKNNITIFHNARFDVPFLNTKCNVQFNNIHDTKILSYLYDPREQIYGLKHWVKKLFNYTYDVDTNTKTIMSKEMLLYNLEDLQVTSLLYEYLTNKLSDKEIELHSFLVKIDLMYGELQNNGIYLDQDYLQQAHAKAVQEFKYLDNEIRDYIIKKGISSFRLPTKKGIDMIYINNEYKPKKGESIFNINSSQHLSHLLYNKLNYTPTQYTKSGAKSVGKDALKDINDELSNMILDYKVLSKQISAFFESLKDKEKMYPEIKITSTLSGRTSCQNPNMQQLPRGKTIRNALKAPEGYCFVEMDYSQAELRCASHIADIKNMQEAYINKIDLHTKTAQLITHKEEVSKEERTHAKIANFGILYGMVAKTLQTSAKYMYGVEMSENEADTIYNNFFKAYPELLQYRTGIKKEVSDNGYIESPIGRRLRIFNKGFEERSFNNAKIQGFASDILLLAMLEMYELPEHNKEFIMLGSVHDAVLMYVKKDVVFNLTKKLKDIMENPKYLKKLMDEPFKVPIVADVDIYTDRWYGEKYKESYES